MNNEPVAWMDKKGNCVPDDVKQFEANNGDWFGGYTIPLHTHPAKTQSHTETAVKILNYLGYSQEPSREEGADARRDKLVEIISQSNPAKTLTDEEIIECMCFVDAVDLDGAWEITGLMEFARAILRKASEK